MNAPAETTTLLESLGTEKLLRSTDDVLAMTLPLLEQVADLHDEGRVAPLEGVDDLKVAGGRVFFERAKARSPRLDLDAVRRIDVKESAAFDIVSHATRIDDEDGSSVRDLRVGDPGDAIPRPMFLSRFVSWEHELGHHDPLTDIYVLGLVLASVALDQSLGDRDTLESFVAGRQHLTTLGPRLHPVVARAILRMTEVSRHTRPQDLRALITTLKTYREQPRDYVNAPPGDSATATPPTGPARRRALYSHLRDRLFDFSRRNRLLYYAATSQTVNLTLGSVPLVLDYKNVDPESLFTWRGRTATDVASCKPVPLARYLRFEDYPYLVSALDQLRLDANRSKTEVGFSPLRLALCFLHWHDLKQAPDERITSPLLLLPVTLEKKKGVRDAVVLTAETDQAEVNPVLRQYLNQLYGMKLPESVDVSDPMALEALEATLAQQIHASEPAVTLTRVDKPRIDLVLAQAKRRLEAYRKRVALSGRHARSHRGFDYSYARAKLHPLGVQMFTHLVYPTPAPNRDLHEAPRPRIFHHSPTNAADTTSAEDAANWVKKEHYHLKDGGTSGGPYEWAFDLCTVSLANFHYRKMSLVRDYAGMLDDEAPHAALDALLSNEARPANDHEAPLPVEERFDVMPADPTQSSAVARARKGKSFIIQGPPGTGKSQTITNLIADYVACGKRVLFVCEKRAAIDVVYHRLKMQGLARLSCLIHDSQGDKKAFVKDLKETYEDWIARKESTACDDARRAKAAAYGTVLGRASRFRAVMDRAPGGCETAVLPLLVRTIELDGAAPLASPVSSFPTHRELMTAAPHVRALEQALRAVGRDARFGQHPLRFLGDEALFADHPESLVTREARALTQSLDAVLASPLARVSELTRVSDLVSRARFVALVRPLIDARALRLLDASSEAFGKLDMLRVDLARRLDVLAKAAIAAAGWKAPLPRDEASTALVHARRFEASFVSRLFAFLSPTFWRLRRVLTSSFDFASKAVPPAWSEVLERLTAKYDAEAATLEVRERARAELRIDDIDVTWELLERAKAPAREQSALTAWLVAKGSDDDNGAALSAIADRARELEARVQSLLRGVDALAPADVRGHVERLEGSASELATLLEPLRRLAAPELARVASLVRNEPLVFEQMERAVSHAGVDSVLRERALDVLGGADWDGLKGDAQALAGDLRRASGEAIIERAQARFLANVRLSNAPVDALSKDDKAKKKAYAAGRKELEHEFSKVTRFKSIRDLATGPSGVVVRDLKPVWLMSPLSVADTLPLDATFDVVVFDEASQIPLEDAAPAAFRGAQTIVVGDEMQLPPTNFFGASKSLASGDDDADDDDDQESVEGELDAQSLLTHAARTLPSTMLGWHYRSRDEALIAFSNRVFYDGKLLTVPAVARTSVRRAITASKSEEGADGAAALLERPISFHHMTASPYEQRRNRGEARYIAEVVRGLLNRANGRTLGVVAFSEAQQDEIEIALRELGDEDPEFRAKYEAEQEREEDGQHVGLFVKNLENVQGDERDIIVISVCYGPGPNGGKMLMNFGPINKSGGEKRLNVIFSRAKHHLAVVSSIRWTSITNDYNDGAACLKSYLRYAEALSVGDVDGATAALAAYRTRKDEAASRGEGDARALETRLATALRARGHEVDVGIGASEFRCNLGVRAKGSDDYKLAILLDDAAQHRRPIDEILTVQPSVLGAFGWRTLTVLHKDWWSDPEMVLRRIETALA